MSNSVSHPISTLDQHQPEGRRPEGWNLSLGFKWGVVRILPRIILYLLNALRISFLIGLDNVRCSVIKVDLS